MGVSTALLILLIAIPTVYCEEHTVGGDSEWTNSGVNYDTWSAGETFKVGDTLLFKYGATHSVAEVNEADYNSCSGSKPIGSYSDGNTKITLDKVLKRYFICPTAGHCESGMKVAINVVADNTPPTTPSTPGTPSPPSGGSTPTPGAGTPPTTPSGSSPPSAPSGNGAAGNIMSLMVGSLVVLGSTLALMG